MGALAVLAMADNAENTPPDPSVRRPVHPFFAQNRPPAPSAENHVTNDPSISSDSPALPLDTTGSGKPEDDIAENPAVQRGRRRKAQHHEDEEDMPKKPRPTKRTRNSAGADIANHFVKLAKECEHDQPADPNAGPLTRHNWLPACIADQVDRSACDPAADSPEVKPSTIEQLETSTHGRVPEPKPAPQAADADPAKPKKLLLFNPKTGTIGSPPKPKEPSAAAVETHGIEKKPPGQRGRKPASKIVRITYGTDLDTRSRLGKLINSILNGQTEQFSANIKQSPQDCNQKPSPKAPKPAAPTSSKATHPFFTGQSKKLDSISEDTKLKKKPDSVAEDLRLKKSDSISEEPKVKKPALSPISARTKHYTSTPYSPRKPRAGLGPKIPMPRFGVKSLGLKFAGAKMPAWPWQGMVHVRGDQSEALSLENEPLPLASRKSKGHAVKVSTNESIITIMVNSLDLSVMAAAIRNLSTDDFIPPPPELRLPQKHFESGSKLQSRILPELKTFHSSAPRKGSAPRSTGGAQAPAQLARLFGSIASSLSAFDMSQCETSNWVQKYAPTCAVEVLQPGQEAFLLRDWLQALMVQSVDTGSAETGKPKAGAKAKAAVAGKKKRRKKFDGFIVSSEDEGYELCEPSDEDADWAPSGSRGILRKTVVRSGKSGKGNDGDKTANALVISGPHGCGKTAAVYAVAKELDFEVFEINSSSRRSGKDVLEKIGDMTRNHHVRQHQSTGKLDAQDAPAEDHTAQDLNSGKQSIMNAFFKPKTATAKPKEAEKPAAKSLQRDVKKEPPKSQRQSLILIEEADILYEEDKQFWTTIVSLIAQAKRPFIITCNDETLIQLHTLRLHGIFRLSSAPRDLAVDRLILVAANEGHALTRKSVEQLYDSRHCDMRAATMDLQYWCQLGVGDRRGGFDWFYPRWPKGVDLDENNEVVRVVSQDTYLPGMDLLGRDSLVDPKLPPRLVEEEVLHQTWELWGLDLGHWQDSVGLGPWAEGLETNITTPADRLGALAAYDDLAAAMSVADICSFKSLASSQEEAIDPTQPDPSAKARDDFVLGITHLHTPVVLHHNTLTTSIAFSIKSLARTCLRLYTEQLQKHPMTLLQSLDEVQAISCLQASFTSTLPGTAAISRMDFAFAFDPIATPNTSVPQPAAYLEPSVFDRTLKLITLDVAPYVRGIVAYESQLQKQRLKLSSLVSEGGKGAKGSMRMRTTRAALSALEGGSRSTTRGERWFKADINPYLVAKTAGEGWIESESGELETPEKSSIPSPERSAGSSAQGSPGTSPDTTPVKMPKKAVLNGRKRKMVVRDDDEADELGY